MEFDVLQNIFQQATAWDALRMAGEKPPVIPLVFASMIQGWFCGSTLKRAKQHGEKASADPDTERLDELPGR